MFIKYFNSLFSKLDSFKILDLVEKIDDFYDDDDDERWILKSTGHQQIIQASAREKRIHGRKKYVWHVNHSFRKTSCTRNIC